MIGMFLLLFVVFLVWVLFCMCAFFNFWIGLCRFNNMRNIRDMVFTTSVKRAQAIRNLPENISRTENREGRDRGQGHDRGQGCEIVLGRGRAIKTDPNHLDMPGQGQMNDTLTRREAARLVDMTATKLGPALVRVEDTDQVPMKEVALDPVREKVVRVILGILILGEDILKTKGWTKEKSQWKAFLKHLGKHITFKVPISSPRGFTYSWCCASVEQNCNMS